MARDKSANQIIRFDGKNTFFEVMNGAFPIGKVQMNFIEYDKEKGNKQTKRVDIYLDIPVALRLCQDILSGKLAMTVATAKKENKFNGQAINDYTSYFTDMGGKNEVNAKREDGKALSRQFKIQSGQRVAWIFRSEQGPGETNATGLIVPKGKAEEFVNVALTDENIKEFALMLKAHIEAYFNHIYSTYHKELFPSEKINVYKKEEK